MKVVICETCNGCGTVEEEWQRGVPGSGGVHMCPDCRGACELEVVDPAPEVRVVDPMEEVRRLCR